MYFEVQSQMIFHDYNNNVKFYFNGIKNVLTYCPIQLLSLFILINVLSNKLLITSLSLRPILSTYFYVNYKVEL